MGYDDNRIEAVFRCIVESYVESALPVGSRVVSKRYGGSLSPASIRNVMTDLEEMGYIAQPHTSAGRIPTSKGYRYYVDKIMEESTEEELSLPNLDGVVEKSVDIEKLAEDVSHLLADLTHNAGLFLAKRIKRLAILENYELDISEHLLKDDVGSSDRLYVDGASHVFEQPEFNDIQRAKALIRAFELKQELAAFLDNQINDESVHVYIGDEVVCEALPDVSVVAKKYSYHDQPMGCLAVVGPTRMHYEKTMRVVDELADSVTQILNEF